MIKLRFFYFCSSQRYFCVYKYLTFSLENVKSKSHKFQQNPNLYRWDFKCSDAQSNLFPLGVSLRRCRRCFHLYFRHPSRYSPNSHLDSSRRPGTRLRRLHFVRTPPPHCRAKTMVGYLSFHVAVDHHATPSRSDFGISRRSSIFLLRFPPSRL